MSACEHGKVWRDKNGLCVHASHGARSENVKSYDEVMDILDKAEMREIRRNMGVETRHEMDVRCVKCDASRSSGCAATSKQWINNNHRSCDAFTVNDGGFVHYSVRRGGF